MSDHPPEGFAIGNCRAISYKAKKAAPNGLPFLMPKSLLSIKSFVEERILPTVVHILISRDLFGTADKQDTFM